MERRRLITMALLLGCALAESATAARRTTDEAIGLLQEALDRLFGRRDSYDLFLYPPSSSDPPGYFPLVELSAEDTSIEGVPLAHVSLTLRAVELDLVSLARGEIRFRRGRVQSLDVLLTERDVKSVIERQSIARKVGNLRVRLSGDEVRVSGRLKLGLLSPEAQLAGGFEVADGGRSIRFVPSNLDVGGCTPGKDALERLQDKINPLVDLEAFARRYNVDLKVKWIRAQSGALRISG